jgi:hypothetical protein
LVSRLKVAGGVLGGDAGAGRASVVDLCESFLRVAACKTAACRSSSIRFDAAPRRNDPTVMLRYNRIFVMNQIIFVKLSS